MTNAANIPAETIETVLATQRQRTHILAPYERMQHMTRVLTTVLPLTAAEAAAYVTDYAISSGILQIEVPA